MELAEYFTCPDRPTFLQFGKLVNARIESRCGLGILDLPDQDYSSLHEDWDGTVQHACDIADEILEEAGFVNPDDPDESWDF
jgi:hypothetical protein